MEETRENQIINNEAVIETAVVPEKFLYVSPDEKSVMFQFKAVNIGKKSYAEKIVLEGHDSHRGKLLYSVPVELSLSPGEKIEKQFTAPISSFGSVRINAKKINAKNNQLGGFYSVIGKYTPVPVDVRKDFVVSVNGGMGYRVPPRAKFPSYITYNSGHERKLQIFSSIGIRLVRDHDGGRTAISWFTSEPQKGKHDFTHLDYCMKMYEKYHISLFPVIGSGDFLDERDPKGVSLRLPQWVADQSERVADAFTALPKFRGKIKVPPMTEWQTYVKTIASRLKGKVFLYEITNEPNLYLGADVYLKYLKGAFEVLRDVDPQTEIVGFSLSSDFNTATGFWMEQIYKLGGLKYADTVSFHPYGSRELGSKLPADHDISIYRDAIKKRGYSDKKLMNSELYYVHDNQGATGHIMDIPVHYAAWRFLTDLGEGLSQSVAIHEDSLWKNILTPGMLQGKSFHELIPNEILVAYNALARYFEGARPAGKQRLPYGTICYHYKNRSGHPIAAVWNYLKHEDLSYDLNGFHAIDMFGNPLPSGSVKIGKDPVYIIGSDYPENEFFSKLSKRNLVPENPVRLRPVVRIADGYAYTVVGNDIKTPLTGELIVSLHGYAEIRQQVKLPPRQAVAVKSLLVPDKNKSGNSNVEIKIDQKQINIPVEVIQNTTLTLGENFSFQSKDGKLKINGNSEIKDKYIIFTLNINDSTPSGRNKTRNPWNTDGIEFFCDYSPNSLSTRDPQQYTEDTFRLFLLPYREEGKRLLVESRKRKVQDFIFNSKILKNGYQIVCGIPFSEKKDVIGFEIKVNDAPGENADVNRQATFGNGTELFKKKCNFSILKLKK